MRVVWLCKRAVAHNRPDAACRRQGLATQFVELPINVSDPAVWEGVKLRYWQLDTYYLPVVQHDEDEDDADDGSEQSAQQNGAPEMQPVGQQDKERKV